MNFGVSASDRSRAAFLRTGHLHFLEISGLRPGFLREGTNMTKTAIYPTALQLLANGKKVALQNTLNVWHIERRLDKNSPVSNIPVNVRVNRDGSRAPWPPNTNDMLHGEYLLADGTEPGECVLEEGSPAWAFDGIIFNGKKRRRVDWKPGMYAYRNGEELHLVLPNGKEVNAEYHHDHFDQVARWEEFTE